ncbi:MAG: putative DNA ligase [Prokaryotic dsDNA virus sp.]|nr:MAG: putative DNA ligase [Prokaryotic dsDNA virus sp.]|tara:strand:- start:558 stop:1937 length:1380 start_codon:yes stop_codon:yes gene_type:complete
MNTLDVLNKLSATTKKTEKEAILNSNKHNYTLKLVFQMAYDKVSYTFNIRKINQDWLSPTPQSGSISLEEALKETNKVLCEQKLRGHAASDFVEVVFSQLSLEDKEVYRRVLLRDLEVGCSESTANSVWEGCISTIPKMLARPSKPANIKNIKFPAIAQKKADGVRGIAVIKDGEVTIYSRNANVFELPSLCKQLSMIGTDTVIDGELIYVDGDREEIRQTGNGIVGKALKGTLSEEEEKNIQFVVWDAIDYEDYFRGFSGVPYHERFALSQSIVSSIGSDSISSIETHEVSSIEEAKELSISYIDEGFEGIVLKNSNAPWEDTRSKHQVKFKAVIDFALRVVGYYPHKKNPNKLGGLILESECGMLRTDCGSGFKDKDTDAKTKLRIPLDERHEHDRELLMVMAEKGELEGMIVAGECNGVSSNKNAKEGEPKYSLHFPIFKYFRFDKESADKMEEIC